MRAIERYFKEITGKEFPGGSSNRTGDRTVRKDILLEYLTVLYYDNPDAFRKLAQMTKRWLTANTNEAMLVLAAHTQYLMEGYQDARDYLLRLITHDPFNLDTWFDLAFTLRHLGAYEEAEVILFEHDHVIYYFKRLGLSGKSYEKLRELLREIREKTTAG